MCDDVLCPPGRLLVRTKLLRRTRYGEHEIVLHLRRPQAAVYAFTFDG